MLRKSYVGKIPKHHPNKTLGVRKTPGKRVPRFDWHKLENETGTLFCPCRTAGYDRRIRSMERQAKARSLHCTIRRYTVHDYPHPFGFWATLKPLYEDA